MTKSGTVTSGAIIALISGFAIWSPAAAQDAAKQGEATTRAPVLEEITVTARRRSESLQTAPISVSAFGANALNERGVQAVSDITNYVPNVQFDAVASESGGGAATQVAIRGIGQTDYVLTVEPGVGVYVDGVYVGKSVGSLLDTVDVDHLEVLRGPQGTLFGKNTIGGAIQVFSKRPSAKPEFFVEATGGSYNRADVKVGYSGPVNDSLRLRFSGAYQSADGYVKRVTTDGTDTGERQGNRNRLSGRVAAEIDLAPNLLATIAVDGTRIREQVAGTETLYVNENSGFAPFYNAGVAGGACLASAGAARLKNPVCYNSQYARPLNSRTTTENGANRSDADIWGASANLKWDLGAVTIKSISAYRHVKVETEQNLTGSQYYVDAIGQRISTKQYSQEFQFNGAAFSNKLKYLLGLFYMRESGTQVFPVDITIVQFLSGGAIKNDSFAAFGQLTYDLTDKLSLTAGLRYTHEIRRFNPAGQSLLGYSGSSATPTPGFTNLVNGAFGAAGTPLFPAGWYSRTSNSATPMATLSYRPARDIMAYASFSQGYKGGGFTMRYFPPVLPAAGTDPNSIVSYAGPEKATAYEIGLKTELFDHRLRFNISGFYTDYKDIQVTYNIDPDGPGPIGDFVPVLSNAGSAHIKGIEIESSLAVSKGFRLDGSLGYTDAKYVNFSAQARANYPGVDAFKLPNTPEWTANIGGTLTLFDTDQGKVSLRADYSYRSSQFKEFTNDPVLLQGAYGLLGAAVTYVAPSKRWQATAGGTNLTNETYIVSGISNPGVGFDQAAVSRPREWYVKLRYNY